jgi:hypothetical protein
MRVRKIKIGIKDVKTTLNEFVKTGEAIERGEKVTKRKIAPVINYDKIALEIAV